jgi:hypothetical protein
LRPQLLERARARGCKINAQTAAETAAVIQEEQTHNTSRTAAGDGTTIHLGPRFPLQDLHVIIPIYKYRALYTFQDGNRLWVWSPYRP